jgi:3-oxoacyl-[acyl-carrier-protein] synthase-3
MRYHNVCLESLGYVLPAERLTSGELESRLGPLYQRLRLPEGRLELISGISERRFWPDGTLPSDVSAESCRRALQAADFDAKQVGALIHGSVCRDRLEPATACRVHHLAGLPADCFVYDVSNACLGILNGALQIANLIELGQIKAGLVVGTESARQLVETTIAALNSDESLNRKNIKPAIASLTIGSASCAMLLTHHSISRSQNRLEAAVARAETEHHELCQSGHDEAVASGMQPLMETDSEQLMLAGVEVGRRTFATLMEESGWNVEDFQRSVCHQVGGTHRKLMLEALGLSTDNDFATFQWLGNTGSAALPTTLAVAARHGWLQANDGVGLLGIGSGLNCVMASVRWQKSQVEGDELCQIAAPSLLARNTRE